MGWEVGVLPWQRSLSGQPPPTPGNPDLSAPSPPAALAEVAVSTFCKSALPRPGAQPPKTTRRRILQTPSARWEQKRCPWRGPPHSAVGGHRLGRRLGPFT